MIVTTPILHHPFEREAPTAGLFRFLSPKEVKMSGAVDMSERISAALLLAGFAGGAWPGGGFGGAAWVGTAGPAVAIEPLHPQRLRWAWFGLAGIQRFCV